MCCTIRHCCPRCKSTIKETPMPCLEGFAGTCSSLHESKMTGQKLCKTCFITRLSEHEEEPGDWLKRYKIYQKVVDKTDEGQLKCLVMWSEGFPGLQAMGKDHEDRIHVSKFQPISSVFNCNLIWQIGRNQARFLEFKNTLEKSNTNSCFIAGLL